jgi:hypothetical protein
MAFLIEVATAILVVVFGVRPASSCLPVRISGIVP